MSYPQIVEYNEAVQNPAQVFLDDELKRGSVSENNLGLPLVLSGGFALTYAVTTPKRKCAVRCFHREIPAIEEKYDAISKTLRSLGSPFFVNFDFQRDGIKIRNSSYPIVRMDWIEGDPLGVWLDKNSGKSANIEKLRMSFFQLASYLEQRGIAHGDIQNGNIIVAGDTIRLIDYDGMYVPPMPLGRGSETGHKHFQHPDRQPANFGPKMDRFSFIALDLSLKSVAADTSLYRKFREGGETIIFKANDFADPQTSEIFKILFAKSEIESDAKNFAAICEAGIELVPSLEDFVAGRNIPKPKPRVAPLPGQTTPAKSRAYISAYPVLDALNFAAAARQVGDRVELIGRIVEIKEDMGKWGRGKGKPYVFINFGPWKGSIVKLSIWSEGLGKLREKPTSAWVGRWVSVTGLIDPPYTSKRYHYTHLSITIQDDGQINQISEAEARFRMGAAVAAEAKSNRKVIEDFIKKPELREPAIKSPMSKTPTNNASQPVSKNKAIVDQYAGSSGQVSSGGNQAHSYSPQSQESVFQKIPGWVWVVAGIIAFYLLANS